MDIFKLNRNFWDFAFENTGLVKSDHIAVYFFAIEHCNRLGWKKQFGFPTSMVMDATQIKRYNTYINILNDLIDWGFIEMVEKSKNQYSSNIIALCNFAQGSAKALDKALTKHRTKQRQSDVQSTVQSDVQSTDSINIPITNTTDRQIDSTTLSSTGDEVVTYTPPMEPDPPHPQTTGMALLSIAELRQEYDKQNSSMKDQIMANQRLTPHQMVQVQDAFDSWVKTNKQSTSLSDYSNHFSRWVILPKPQEIIAAIKKPKPVNDGLTDAERILKQRGEL